ncbi:MAG: hypothetical protein IPH31_17990 [Lewinellaceae bacterium]|nr:hypothetical protein [Lewinellaceae bacterium]
MEANCHDIVVSETRKYVFLQKMVFGQTLFVEFKRFTVIVGISSIELAHTVVDGKDEKSVEFFGRKPFSIVQQY